MKDLIDRFIAVEKDIADEKGGFSLFALFLREEGINTWDLVVSAPWFGKDELATLKYISEKLRSHLRKQDYLNLSRIVLLDPDDERVRGLQNQFQTEHDKVEVRNAEFFDMQMSRAYIITASSNGVTAHGRVR